MSESLEQCVICKNIEAMLNEFIQETVDSLPEVVVGHEEQTKENVVTGVLLHTVLDRVLAEVGNPLKVIAILNREVIRRCSVQVIDTRAGNPAPQQPPPQEPISDEELLNLPGDKIGNA